MRLQVIEYPEDGCWYLTFGNKAPWQNVHVRIPEKIAVIVMRFL